MKELKQQDIPEIAGGLDPRQYETQVSPEPPTSDPLVVVDFNPPPQPPQ